MLNLREKTTDPFAPLASLQRDKRTQYKRKVSFPSFLPFFSSMMLTSDLAPRSRNNGRQQRTT